MKSRKQQRQRKTSVRRMLAVLLTVCMTVGMMPGLSWADTGGKDKKVVITEFEPLAENIAEQEAPLGTRESELNLPSQLKAVGYEQGEEDDTEPTPHALTVTGVKWETDELYDETAVGETFTFTAVLPERYILEDAELPQITVTLSEKDESDIGENIEDGDLDTATKSDADPECTCTAPCSKDQVNADCPVCREDYSLCTAKQENSAVLPSDEEAVKAVLAMIDALPAVDSIYENIPGDSDPEFATWMKKMQETFAAIKEAKAAYDALSAEEKALVDGEHTDKLSSLVSLVERLDEIMTMEMNGPAKAPGGYRIQTVSALQTALGGSENVTVNGNTVTMKKDIAFGDKPITVYGGELVLDLNGHTLSSVKAAPSSEEYIITVLQSASFTIKDSSPGGTGRVMGDGSFAVAILFQDSSNMVIDGGAYEVIKFPSNGTATIYKGSIDTLWRQYITTSNKKFNNFFPAGTSVTVEGKAFTSEFYDKSKLSDVEAVQLDSSLSEVYLGLHGTDNSTGGENSPVRSFARAKELVEDGGTIYLKPYYRPVGSNETWSLSGKSGVTVKRAPGTTGTMVEVQSQTLTLEDISFDGSLDGSSQDLGAIIKADFDAKLIMSAGTELKNNKGMAVHIDNASFTMSGGTIENCKSSDLVAINVGTNYNSSREIKLTGGTVEGNISSIGGDIKISPSFGVNGSISLSGRSKLIFTDIPVKNYSLLLGKGYIIPAGTVIVELTNGVSGSLDLSKFTLNDDNFTLMMGNGDTAGKIVRIAVISNTNELKSAINESAGTEDVPANIFIKQNGFNVDTTINIPSDKYVKITGGTLTRDNDLKSVPLFNVQGGLTLENITLDGNKENASGDGLVEVDGGKLMLNTGAVLQNNKNPGNGGAVRVCGGGSVTMNDGEITGNEALAGGGVFAFAYFNDADGGTFTMNGGEISGNTADAGSGVYIAKKGALNLHSGATISGNAAPENVSQGAWDGDIEIELRRGSNNNTRSIFNTQTSRAASFGVTIPSSPDSWGGGIYNKGAFTMDGGEISNNTAGRGGAVYHADGSCTITGGVINGNHNTFSGTGLYAREDFSVGGGADLKDGIYLVAGKKALVTSALSNGIQIEGMEGTSVSGTVVAEGSSYTISDDDFAKFTCQTYKWTLKKNADGQIILAVNSSAAPVFTTSTYTKASANENTAKFTLDSAADSSTGFKVYEAETGGDALTDVTAEAQGTTLTLTGISGVTSETDYYISATETGKSESSRTAVTVNPYAPVTLGDENSDKTVEVTFLTTDADTVTKNDTIDVVFHKGTNPDDTFEKEAFSFFNGDNKKADREVIDDLTVTNVDEENGTLTVTMAKSVAPTDHKAYLWYRYNDTTDYYVGEITIDKTVKTPSIPPDTKTQAPVLESATAVFASDAANSVTYTLKSVPENTTYQLYGEQEGGDALSAPIMTLDTDKKTLTLTFASKPTEDTDYYLAATEQGKEESSRVAITVRKYAAPSAALGEDSTVAVKFQSSDAETVTDTDTIKVILNKGTNPDYSFTSDLFSLSSSNSEKKAIDDLSITGLNVDEGTITVQMAKRVTAETAYLWYGEQSIGQITISKTVETPQSSDKQITGFTIADQIGETEFDQTAYTIKVTMPAGTTVTNLTPTITVSTGAAVSPASEVAQDFSSPVTYTVTAEDGSTQNYTVTVEVQSQTNLISEVDVTGITTPVAGATPDTSAKDGTHWSAGTVTWDPNHTAFAYETQYTASVTITAAEGYQFAKEGALTATVDGEDAEVTRTSDTVITVSYEFPATDAEGDTYRVTYNLTNLTADGQPEQVEKDGELEAALTAEEGYELPDTITVKMDGQTLTAGSDYTYDSESGTVRITTVTGNVVITAEGVSDGTFIAVTDITGVPEFTEVGKALKLKGTVKPSNATNQDITWEITDDGGTGASLDDQNHLTAETGGEVTVTATIANGLGENQEYTEEFTIRVGEAASASDAAYVASASNAVKDGKYKVDQSTTEDESSFLTELVNLINKILENLFGIGKTEKVETSDISNLAITVDPVAGDEDDHSGSDGEFTFDVEIHKGDESQTVEGLTGTIKATPFTDEDQAAKDQEAVDNAITEIEDGTYKVRQENAGNEAALKKALKEKAKKKAGKAAVNEIQIVEVEYATAGTRENPDGEAGTFTFKAKVSKGSVQDIWTEEIEGTIVPEKYVLKKPEITTLSLPDGTVGTEYSAQLTAKSDTEITWGLEGSLPAGLTLSEDGEISGMPEAAGQTSFKVTADNGSEQGTASRNYTITINAKTGETEHTITVVSRDGGTVNPSGAVRVADGADQKFTITPAGGYYISKVLVDGNSVGRPAEYTFRNVTGDHTIEAVFARGSVGPGTDDGDDDNGGGGNGGGGNGGGSNSTTGTTSKTPSTSTNTATVEGGSVTTTTTTSTDNSGKKTTVTTQVTKDTAGNVTGSTTTVTTDNIQISVGEGVSHVTVRPDGSAMNSAAASVGATAQNPLRVQIEVPHTAAVNEFAKPEIQSVAVDVMIPNAAANNPNVEIGVTIGKETIQAAKDAGKNVAVTVRNENGTVEAVWSFDGAAMRNTNSEAADVSLGLHVVPVQSEDPSAQAVKPLAAARGTENGLVLDISGAGRLTAPTKLTVPATNQTGIKAGDQVALYRHDPLTGTLVPVPGGSYTVDVNGNVTIDLPAKDFAAGPDRYVLLPVLAAGIVPPAIPATAGATTPYEIKRGDTLNKIAREYGCTVEELLELNQVDVMDLRIGQVIQLPAR